MLKEKNHTQENMPVQITVEEVSDDYPHTTKTTAQQATTPSNCADIKSPINHSNFYLEINQTPKEALRTPI